MRLIVFVEGRHHPNSDSGLALCISSLFQHEPIIKAICNSICIQIRFAKQII